MSAELLLFAVACGVGNTLAVWGVVRPQLNSLRAEMRDLASRLSHTEPGELR